VTVVHQSEEFEVWLESLDPADRRAVNRVVALLEMQGVILGGSKATEPAFYRRAIERAEPLWIAHLARLTREDRS
jgi:hypothetical protein